jgi:hypothetical protein
MKMIQRFLYTVLKNGLDQIAADPTLLEDLFKDNYQLSNTEMDSIKTFFENNPITLKHGYAHVEDKFPLMTIVLGSEGENEKYIGYDAGQVEDPDDPDFGADCKSSMWKHTYHILNYAEHPDVTTYMYEIAKQALVFGLPAFAALDLFDIDISGADMDPNQGYLPANMFGRQLTFVCSREFQTVDRGSRLGKAFKVSGIHVDKEGSSSDVGAVNTNVTVIGD